jgi:hypothetical protein
MNHIFQRERKRVDTRLRLPTLFCVLLLNEGTTTLCQRRLAFISYLIYSVDVNGRIEWRTKQNIKRKVKDRLSDMKSQRAQG